MDPSLSETPFNVYRTRVRSHQTDLNAAMYHGAFLDVFDDARVEVFRRMGYDYTRMLGGSWGLVIRRVECEYLSPARMDDELEITVNVVGMSVATMTVRYRCTRQAERVADAVVTFAFLDGRGRPVRFPADLKQVIQDHPDFIAKNSDRPGSSRRSPA